jgi:hypothetical protein
MLIHSLSLFHSVSENLKEVLSHSPPLISSLKSMAGCVLKIPNPEWVLATGEGFEHGYPKPNCRGRIGKRDVLSS